MGRTIITIFAGRKNVLLILIRYLVAAVEAGIIDEIHFWDFSRLEEDREFLRNELCGPSAPAYIHLFPVTNIKSWKEYYYHYGADNTYANDVIIKCDDDIVFIDIPRLPDFIRYVREKPDPGLVFANIINNGVAAYFQQEEDDLIPKSLLSFECPEEGFEGTLWESGHKAQALHRFFLADPTHFTDHDFSQGIQTKTIDTRFSINFFGVQGRHWPMYIAGRYADDELELTVGLVQHKAFGFRNELYKPLFVSHLGFFRQRETGLDSEYLCKQYTALADSFIHM